MSDLIQRLKAQTGEEATLCAEAAVTLEAVLHSCDEAMKGAIADPIRHAWDEGYIEGVKATVTVVRACLRPNVGGDKARSDAAAYLLLPKFRHGSPERLALDRLYDEEITVAKCIELIREAAQVTGQGGLNRGD